MAEEVLMSDPTIGFVGSGAAANALARAFAAAGYRVAAVSSRRLAQAVSLADALPGCVAFDAPQQVVNRTDLVFLTVPDGAIGLVCRSLMWSPGISVVHCSGAHSTDLLAVAARAGTRVGAFHPLQSFAGGLDDTDRLAGSVCGIEADEPLRSTLTELVQRVGGHPVYLTPESKALYHASATVIANYVVTLASLAAELWETFGVPRDDALRALLPLLSGAVANLERSGLPDALTGPIARGDAATLKAHLDALHHMRPDLVPLYRELGYKTVELALERRLDARCARAVQAVLACAAGDDAAPE